MTDTIAADHRRATALVVHYGNENQEGVDAILLEAGHAERLPHLLYAVLQLHAGIVPQVYTELGLGLVNDLLLAYTANPDAATAVAAQVIVADATGTPWPPEALSYRGARIAELTLRVIAVQRAVTPALYSTAGLEALQRSVATWAQREADDD